MHEIKKLIMNLFLKFGSLFKIKNLIIFESLPTLTDSSRCLYDYLIEHHYNDKYEIIWFSDQNCHDVIKEENVRIVKVWTKFRKFNLVGFCKYFYYLKNAKYIIYCNRGLHKINRRSTTIYLTHGIPLKDVSKLPLVSPKIDYVVSPSEFIRNMFSEQFHVSREKILTLGIPRNDTMFNYQKEKRSFDFMTKKYAKVILWLPTFREHSGYNRNDSSFNFPLGIPVIYNEKDLKKIDNLLKKEKTLLLIKPHPVQDMRKFKSVNLSNIKLIMDDDLKRNDILLFEFYFYVDSIMTDYSSVYYDALIANKPIGFTIDDFKEYQATRGFPFDNPLDKMAGMKIRKLEDLEVFIKDISKGIDNYQEKRNEILNLFYDNLDGDSCKRIVEYFKF